MRWRWIETEGAYVLRAEPRPAGVGEFGFVGRARPGARFLEDRSSVRLGQVHGAHVVSASSPGSVAGCDGAHTRTPDLVLTVRTADCVPVLLAAPEGVALLHAGWRGLIAGILEAGLGEFPDRSRLRVVLGPAIGPCCYEVGPEVARLFPAQALRSGHAERSHLDLYRAARMRLVDAGVPASAIDQAPFCTRCHQHVLASSRGSGGGADRILAFATFHP
jgi:purine-nucleoside/S-methyl-5'-thioadenosine phosphorylase / adenosine deaminase